MFGPYLTYIKLFGLGLLCAFLIGLGYKWGSSGTAKAEAALAAYKLQVATVQATQQQALEALRTTNTALSKDLATLTSETDKKVSTALQTWQQKDQQKDARINALRKDIAEKEARLASLTDKEKKDLENAIILADGLACLKTPIPLDYIELINAYEPKTDETPPLSEVGKDGADRSDNLGLAAGPSVGTVSRERSTQLQHLGQRLPSRGDERPDQDLSPGPG